jgi:hypothetical protein
MQRAYSSQSTLFANSPKYTLASPLTIIAIFNFTSLAAGAYGHIAACQDDPSTAGWELRLSQLNTATDIDFHRANATGFVQYAANPGVSIISNNSQNNCIAITSNTKDIHTAPTIIANGISYTGTIVDDVGAGNQTASTDSLRFGIRTDSITLFAGSLLFFGLWNRALSYIECARIRSNPWQLLQHKRADYFSDVIGAPPAATFRPTRALTGVGY